ncbi:hypothetical protein [Microbulbifer hainanensis]|uniref:hypothetical protein n=1 Tax=Microbulbifer hainanensis TaxID=2735675 RepID=UPI0018675E5D|nr:hypothetical protein [Microbulbifer hainanensis]
MFDDSYHWPISKMPPFAPVDIFTPKLGYADMVGTKTTPSFRFNMAKSDSSKLDCFSESGLVQGSIRNNSGSESGLACMSVVRSDSGREGALHVACIIKHSAGSFYIVDKTHSQYDMPRKELVMDGDKSSKYKEPHVFFGKDESSALNCWKAFIREKLYVSSVSVAVAPKSIDRNAIYADGSVEALVVANTDYIKLASLKTW